MNVLAVGGENKDRQAERHSDEKEIILVTHQTIVDHHINLNITLRHDFFTHQERVEMRQWNGIVEK